MNTVRARYYEETFMKNTPVDEETPSFCHELNKTLQDNKEIVLVGNSNKRKLKSTFTHLHTNTP